MIPLAERTRAEPEAGLAMARHMLRARIVRPAGRSRGAANQALTMVLYYLSVILSLLLVNLRAGPKPLAAAEPEQLPLTEQVLRGKFAIAVPSFSSLSKPAAALAEKVLPGLSAALRGGGIFARAEPSRPPRTEARR